MSPVATEYSLTVVAESVQYIMETQVVSFSLFVDCIKKASLSTYLISISRHMIIIPYTYKDHLKKDRSIHEIRILTEGGQEFWNESDLLASPQEALDTNELRAKRRFIDGGHHYFEIDTTVTAVQSMYDWTELPLNTGELCWRTFYIITDDQGNPWIQIPEGKFKSALEIILRLPKTQSH